MFLIPRDPLVAGTYSVAVSQPGQPDITWSFQDDSTVTLQPLSGSDQKAAAGQVFDSPLVAQLTDKDADGALGGPLDGTRVTFTVTSGSASFATGDAVAVVTTGSQGIATSPALVGGDTPGPVTVIATASWAVAAVSYNLTVEIGTQTINFIAPASGAVGSSARLTATGGPSGEAVVFSVAASSGSGVCKVSGANGSNVRYTAPGVCIIDANQAGDDGFKPARQVPETITVLSNYPSIAPLATTAAVSNVTLELELRCTSVAVCGGTIRL